MEEKYTQTAGAPQAKGSKMGGMMGAKLKPMPAEGEVRPVLFSARLKVENGESTEIETIIARENGCNCSSASFRPRPCKCG